MFSSYNPPTISSIYIEGLEISAKDAEAAAIAARDAAQAARDDALKYRNETHTYYTQVQQIQTGDYVTTQSLNDALSAFSFSDLASVPTSFTPSAHSHAWGDISGKPSAFTPAYHTHLWAHITDKPTEFEPAEHVHTWQQIAQKPGTFPPESHYHAWADIEGKPSAFNPAAHTHSWGDISGKPTKFEPVVHTHDWSAIDNKPLAFPPQSHTHHWDTVTNKPAQATRWPTFTEVTGKPAQAVRWPTWSEVTSKPIFGTAAAADVTVGRDDTTPGRLLKVGDFGIGSNGVSYSDWNAIPAAFNGFIAIDTTGAANRPEGLVTEGYAHIISFGDNNESYILKKTNGSTVEVLSRTAQGVWIVHGEFLHTGNSVNALEYGLGGTAKFISFDDWDELINYETGFYASYQVNRTAIPNSPAFYSNSAINTLIEVKREGARFVVVVYETKIGALKKFERVHGGSVWGSWKEEYHSGNTNLDTFGGGNSNEKLADGKAKFSNFAVFGVDVSFLASARSIETNGTFKIIDANSGNVIIDGINGLSISSESSNKKALVTFNAGASIFTTGQELELYSNTSGAFFKVGV